MGFFSELKQDLTQAVNELTEESVEKELLEEEERLKSDVSAMTEEEDTISYEPAEQYVDVNSADELAELLDIAAAAEKAEVLTEETEVLVEEVPKEAMFTEEESMEDSEEIYPVEPETEEIVKEEPEEMLEETKTDVNEMVTAMKDVYTDHEEYDSLANENVETGIIPAGMMITGDITTPGAMDLRGTILGNLEIGGKLNVSGSIQGNTKAVEIYAQAAKITGDISCDNSVKVGSNTVVIGNISARSAVVAGAIKGDLDIRGPVILDSSAIVKGNIKSKSVQINNGAVIEGMCSQCYADVNPSSFFEGLED